MKLSRRDFLMLTVGLAAAGCRSVGSSPSGKTQVINAGPASDYAKDGVYSRYRDYGFFIVRRGDKLFALSSFCTHRKCKLMAESDNTFYCKCHGSTFDANGKVTEGPAYIDLPVPGLSTNEAGQLIVTIGGK